MDLDQALAHAIEKAYDTRGYPKRTQNLFGLGARHHRPVRGGTGPAHQS